MSDNPEILCTLCGKTYTNQSNLNRHLKTHHSGLKKKEKPTEFFCEHCCRSFPRLFNLQRHIRNFHSATSKERNFRFFCELCTCKFRYKSNYNSHLKQKHLYVSLDAKPGPKLLEYKCAICDFIATKKQLLLHFVESHNIILQETQYTFDTLEDFISWKASYEFETNSKFVNDYTTDRDGNLYKAFKCSYCPKEGLPSKLRRREEHFCPATIRVRKSSSASVCTVVVLDTHVGHKLEKRELKVAKMNEPPLVTKIPFNDIFDEFRSESNLPLVTDTDLFKIETNFNLFTTLNESDDALEQNLWIKELQDLNDAILFYKAENTIFEDYKELKREDLVLVIMTEIQAKMLKTYGPDGVCIDLVVADPFKTSEFRIRIVSILVEDEEGEVFPCGFLICNKIKPESLRIFFMHIRHKIGERLKPNVLMTDMDNNFVKSWCANMLAPNMHLFNPWSVDHAWRKHLKSKVKSIEKQLAVYQMLWSLWEQTDKKIFELHLEKLYDFLLDDPETATFATYFGHYFMNQENYWAFCHKGLNNNLRFEKTHRALKCMYLMGQKVNRFDKIVSAIMRFVRDKFLDRFVELKPKNMIKTLCEISDRHQESSELSLKCVASTENGGWRVLSRDEVKLYAVQKVKDVCECMLKCSECNSCVHQYLCSCIDASINYNMCKHIHLVCRHPGSATAGCAPLPVTNSIEVTFDDEDVKQENADEDDDCKLIEVIEEDPLAETISNIRRYVNGLK